MEELSQSDEIYTVYCLRFPNNKMYIGITSKDPTERWHNGHGYHHSQVMSRAIKKYGWENVDKEILLTGLTKEEATSIEIGLIKQYQLTNHDHGYNTSIGGELGPTLDVADELVELWNTGMTCTEIATFTHHDRHVVARILKESGVSSDEIQDRRWEAISNKSKAKGNAIQEKRQNEVIKLWKEGYAACEIRSILSIHPNALYDSLHACGITSEEINNRTNIKFLNGEIPKNSTVPIGVNQYDKSGHFINSFYSASEASAITGIKEGAIRAALRGRSKTSGGFRWAYDKGSHKDLEEIILNKGSVQVVQCSKDDVQLAVFKSISEAARAIGNVNPSLINQALSGRVRYAYGYKWKKYEDADCRSA